MGFSVNGWSWGQGQPSTGLNPPVAHSQETITTEMFSGS
jgi:hypothetical protein